MTNFSSIDLASLAHVTGGKNDQPPSCGPTINIGSNNGSNNKVKINGKGSHNSHTETTNGNGNGNGSNNTVGIPPLLPGALT